MAKPMNATSLRSNLYQTLDRVLETGEPQEIVRGGRSLLLVPAGKKRLNLDALPKRKFYVGSAEDLIATSWESEWKPDL